MGSSSVSISANTFNGSSTYASSLQQAINHAVAIASLPVELLQNDVTDLQGQSSELSKLQSNFASIGTALQSLTSANGGAGLGASVGDPTVATATVDSSAAIAAGTYQINVINPGSATTTLSNTGLPTVADPTATSITSAATLTLTVNGTATTITPQTNSLNALAQAINSSNAGVNATIINIGPPSAPDYRLSLQSTSLGASAIQLNDGSDLLTTLNPGAAAQYQVNGQPSIPISSNSSTVTIAPGVTVNLIGAGSTTVTVGADPTAAENAISAFVSAYNAAGTELATNHGTSGGALTGQSVVLSLQQSLRSIIQYTGGTGGVQNLADIGITVNSTGQLSFDQTKFESVSAANPQDLATFLGTSTGTGFLATASNTLNALDDPTSGTIQSSINSIQTLTTADSNKITDDQNSIVTMQNNLTQQMSEADAAIAALQSQLSYYSQLFTASQNALQFG